MSNGEIRTMIWFSGTPALSSLLALVYSVMEWSFDSDYFRSDRPRMANMDRRRWWWVAVVRVLLGADIIREAL